MRSSMSRSVEFYIIDILIAADKVHRYTKEFEGAQSFLHSELEWDATIRELEIIGEGTKHLIKNDFLDQEYQSIVDFRNHIAHGYFGVDENIVWEVVTDLLDQFIEEILINVRKSSLDLSFVINSAKDDYVFSHATIAFLNSLSITILSQD